MYQIIDLTTYPKRKNYEWFASFPDPCYFFSTKMDVTKLVEYSKRTKTSFFINCLYLTFQAMNVIPEFRMRQIGDEIRLYDERTMRPAYIVMTGEGVFENAESENGGDYREFYDNAHKVIESVKTQKWVRSAYNVNNDCNEYYFSCTPWISLESMCNPIPANNPSSCSVPRIFWDKYREENGKIVMMLNITVSHAFVDGYPLSKAFLNAQKNYDSVEELCR